MGRDPPLGAGKVALHLLHVRRRHGLAVGPLHVPEHLFIPLHRVMVALQGIPSVLVGNAGVQMPRAFCQHTAQIRKGGAGGLRRAGYNVLGAAGRIVFGAGGVCHKALLLPCVRGAFPPPAGGHPLIFAGAGFGGGSGGSLVYGRLLFPGRDHLVETLGNGVGRRFLGSLNRSWGRCAPALDHCIQTIFNTAHSPSWLPPK